MISGQHALAWGGQPSPMSRCELCVVLVALPAAAFAVVVVACDGAVLVGGREWPSVPRAACGC